MNIHVCICKAFFRLTLQNAQHNATQCSTLQRIVKNCNTLHVLGKHSLVYADTVMHCNTLQHSATHCNTLQHVAAHYTLAATEHEPA